MKHRSLLLLLALFAISAGRAEKYGLIIAVGDYPQSSGWSDISSANDVPLIRQALLLQDFKEENIRILLDSEATRKGILEALAALQSNIKPGDYVVIHYSGHGQQIFDDNGEEIDDKDEALVPYDALVRYTGEYTGQNHIRDDEWGRILTQIRNLLGKQGQLIVTLDSCHSGSSTRGAKARGGAATFAPPGWSPEKRAENSGSGLMEQLKVSEDAAPFILISGASADELNYEYQGTGSLSYAFSRAMSELGSDATFRQLFSRIAATMNVISPRQNPTLEGDADYQLFNGSYVRQQPYYEVKQVARTNVIRLASGKLHHLFEGTTVQVVPEGTRSVSEDVVLSEGTITKANFNDAIVTLETPLKSANEKEYWVFVKERTYGEISLNVYMDDGLAQTTLGREIGQELERHPVISLTADSLQSNVILDSAEDRILLSTPGAGNPFSELSANEPGLSATIADQLADFAQGSYLKNLSIKNYNYEFEFELLPANVDAATGLVTDVMDPDRNLNETGIFQVNTTDDYVVLKVTNKGSRPVYFSIVEINTQGQITPFMPQQSCNITNEDRKIPPGKSKIFRECPYRFYPPFETLLLKGFATPNPINFKPTVETRGSGAGTRSAENPLEAFIGNTYGQSRGSGTSRVSGKIDGFSSEFVYKIVED